MSDLNNIDNNQDSDKFDSLKDKAESTSSYLKDKVKNNILRDFRV